jgi:hypothetical protein
MIQNDFSNGATVKDIKRKEQEAKDKAIKEACEKLAQERFSQDQVIKWSNANKGLFYLPILDSDGNIIKLGIMKPINRHILSYASTKINDGGLYEFLEACMRECWIEGDNEILDDDEFFIPAANSFNKILEGWKAHLLKR